MIIRPSKITSLLDSGVIESEEQKRTLLRIQKNKKFVDHGICNEILKLFDDDEKKHKIVNYRKKLLETLITREKKQDDEINHSIKNGEEIGKNIILGLKKTISGYNKQVKLESSSFSLDKKYYLYDIGEGEKILRYPSKDGDEIDLIYIKLENGIWKEKYGLNFFAKNVILNNFSKERKYLELGKSKIISLSIEKKDNIKRYFEIKRYLIYENEFIELELEDIKELSNNLDMSLIESGGRIYGIDGANVLEQYELNGGEIIEHDSNLPFIMIKNKKKINFLIKGKDQNLVESQPKIKIGKAFDIEETEEGRKLIIKTKRWGRNIQYTIEMMGKKINIKRKR